MPHHLHPRELALHDPDPDGICTDCDTPTCRRSTGDPRLILGKGYRLVVLGGYGRTDPLLNKPFYPNGLVIGILTWYQSEGLGFESQCVHFGHPSAGGCQRSTGDLRLILGKGYRLVVLGGYGRTDPLFNKPFYPSGLVTGILTWYQSEGLGFESKCVHFGHPSAGGCHRSIGDPRLILGKGYSIVVLGGYGRTDPLLNKPFYPSGLPSRAIQPSRAAPTEPRSTYRAALPCRSVLRCPFACFASAAPAATAATATMASPTVLTFDAQGRVVEFDVWWTTRDAVARLAVRSHVPPAERAYFGQYKTAKSLYDAVVARYSSPATAALSHLMLPYLFPDLAAFATVADLITHLRTSDARYRAALPTEFLHTNQPPMYITLYYLVTRLPDSLASVRDHFLSLCPTELFVNLLEERLTAAEEYLTCRSGLRLLLVGGTATARARGARLVEGMAGAAAEAVEEAERVAVEVGVVPGVGATVAAERVVEAAAGMAEAAGVVVEAAAAVVEVAAAVVLVEVQPRSVEALVAASASSSRVRVRPRRSNSFLPRWGDLLRHNVAIFDLDFDAILAAMYALTDSAEGDCYMSVPPEPGIEVADLGASASAAPGAGESVAPGAGESALSGIAPTEALHTFTLDSGASRSFFRDSTTLTPLTRPVAVSLANPSRGPVRAHSSTVLPCPAAPSSLLSGLHLPSLSTNLVSGADLQDAWVDQFTPGGQRVTHCTCSQTGHHLATFTRRPGSSPYTLTTTSPPVSASGQVAASSQVLAATSKSRPSSAPCSCRPLSHETLLWHHRLGHPSLPRLQGMASFTLGRQRAAPHSSMFSPPEAPVQTLHMDVWGPARVHGQGHERYFLLVVDDYSRYTIVVPLRRKGEVTMVLIDWIRGARRQLSERFGSNFPVLRLHPNRGCEFFFDLLKAFCRAEGIRQTFTLPASPQKNGIAERRIGMVLDVARTSMIHAAAPHFLWLFAVQYAAHQLNLQPRVSFPETTPTLRWTGKVGDASLFRVWGSRAFVGNTSADKLSSRAVPCVFLGFPPDAPGWQFYHPNLTSCIVLSGRHV
ncbi:unnamed protein product [Closterium sp. NIES-54]